MTGVAALSRLLDGSPGGAEIHLLPAGPSFRASDGSGRPDDVAAWRIDAGIAARLVAAQRARGKPCVIDYEHQTLLARDNGQPAPAAGWFDALEWREGRGLFATGVRWTARARAHLKADEYRYISPVFSYARPSGEIVALHMAALTNDPGCTELSAAALSARLAALDFNQENAMEKTLSDLRAALGLAADADAPSILAGVVALKSRADLGLKACEELAALKSAQSAAAAAPAEPDPAKYVKIEALAAMQDGLARLSAKVAAFEAEKIIAEARAAGKIVSDDFEAHLKTIADVAALKALVDKLPAVAALKGMQTAGANPGAAPAAASQADAEVMQALGLTAEQFAKGKKE
jgi:phage I-like protein